MRTNEKAPKTWTASGAKKKTDRLDSNDGPDKRRREIRNILADLCHEIRGLPDSDESQYLCTALAYTIRSRGRRVGPERAAMIAGILGRVSARFSDLAGRRS